MIPRRTAPECFICTACIWHRMVLLEVVVVVRAGGTGAAGGAIVPQHQQQQCQNPSYGNTDRLAVKHVGDVDPNREQT